MSTSTQLKARKRENLGKGGARAARREGFVPAIIYGGKDKPMAVSVDAHQLALLLRYEGFMNHPVVLDIDGKDHRVLPKDVQYDVVRDFPLHVDFLSVTEKSRVTVAVPLHFRDEDKSPGLKSGGVLNVIHHDIEVTCAVANIPEFFEISLEGKEIGDGIHLADLSLPQDVEATAQDSDMTVATIVAPTVAVETEATAEEGAEAEAEDEDKDKEKDDES
ncbi:MAG: 50S ribosomal protein L25/general stress protein Ctc [Alphaproteobacteria bacterium GM202ARS2]|nr:50S ribosomal protein L25/general stress protein Ctc [Alphaproteobacteria bacterium GM202ARS2]